jgi:hypothetical protein
MGTGPVRSQYGFVAVQGGLHVSTPMHWPLVGSQTSLEGQEVGVHWHVDVPELQYGVWPAQGGTHVLGRQVPLTQVRPAAHEVAEHMHCPVAPSQTGVSPLQLHSPQMHCPLGAQVCPTSQQVPPHITPAQATHWLFWQTWPVAQQIAPHAVPPVAVWRQEP